MKPAFRPQDNEERLADAGWRYAVTGVILMGLAWGLEHAKPRIQRYAQVMYSPAPTRLAVPVQGVSSRALVSTWGAPRQGGRTHQGIDIFARRGTPVVSPVRGFVLGVGEDRLGGTVVRVLGPGRQVHYFAHLDRAAALERWQWIEAGEVIGFVGTSGNARGTPAHLHYGLYAAGRAIDPYPLLSGRAAD